MLEAKEPPFKFSKKVDPEGAAVMAVSWTPAEQEGRSSEIEILRFNFDLRVRSAVKASNRFSKTAEAESEREGIRSRNRIESFRVDSILKTSRDGEKVGSGKGEGSVHGEYLFIGLTFSREPKVMQQKIFEILLEDLEIRMSLASERALEQLDLIDQLERQSESWNYLREIHAIDSATGRLH